MSKKNSGISKNFAERLLILMCKLGFKDRQQANFARKVGISASFLSDILNCKSGPSFGLLSGISNRFPEANIYWLLTGFGHPLDTERSIVKKASSKIPVSGGNIERVDEAYLDDYLAVPIIEGKIAAKPGRMNPEDIDFLVFIPRSKMGRRTNLVAVKLKQNEKSMHPALEPGSVVVIDRADKRIVKKGIYAIRSDDGDCTFKRIHILEGIVLLLSDSREIPPLKAPTEDLARLIIGRVIFACQILIKGE